MTDIKSLGKEELDYLVNHLKKPDTSYINSGATIENTFVMHIDSAINSFTEEYQNLVYIANGIKKSDAIMQTQNITSYLKNFCAIKYVIVEDKIYDVEASTSQGFIYAKTTLYDISGAKPTQIASRYIIANSSEVVNYTNQQIGETTIDTRDIALSADLRKNYNKRLEQVYFKSKPNQ
jgi:hypothetical protein